MEFYLNEKTCIKYDIYPENPDTKQRIKITEICTTAKELILPDSINEMLIEIIDEKAMENNKTVEVLTLPSKLRRIESKAFSNCIKLRQIEFPEKLRRIWFQAFFGCISLESVNLKESSAVLSKEAFKNCSNLKEIILSDEIEYIDAEVFNNTAYFNNKDNWKDGLLYIGNHLVAVDIGKVPEKIKVKDGTLTIASHVFMNCNAEQIILPDGLITIGYKAFEDCGALVYIPESVGELEYDIM